MLRSIVYMVVGLLVGLAIGLLVNFRSGVRVPAPGDHIGTVTQIPESGVTLQPVPTAPGSLSVTSAAVVDEPLKPLPPVDQIVDYRQLIDALRTIEHADPDTLEVLAVELAATWGDQRFAQALNTAVYQRWAQVDFSAALDFLLSALQTGRDLVMPRLHEGFEVLAQIRPDEMQRQVASLPRNGEHYPLESMLLFARASKDPRQLALQSLASGQADDPASAEMMWAAIDAWAQQDPLSALDFVNSELDASQRNRYLQPIFFNWQAADPDAALSHLAEMITSGSVDLHQPDNLSLLDLYITRVGRSDPRSAFALLQQQASADVRQMMMQNLLYVWADSDVGDLIAFAESEDPSILDFAIEPIAQSLAMSDPASALQWAAQVPEAQKHGIMTSVVGQWIHQDPAAAAQWLVHLPGTELDRTLWAMAAMSMSTRDPGTADLLFEKLPATEQTQLTQIMVRQSLQNGEDSARGWIDRQSNTQVRQIGHAIPHAMQPDADVAFSLDAIASLPIDDKLVILAEAIQQLPYNRRAEATDWLSTTALLDEQAREHLARLTDPAGDAGYYTRPERQFQNLLGPGVEAEIRFNIDRQ